jgi:hypothetical protein
MLPHVFNRLFSQYRDPAFITGRFQFTASGTTWAQITTNRQTTYGNLVVSHRGTGLGTMTFPASRNACIMGAYLEPLGDAITNIFEVKFKLLTPTTGTVDFVINDNAATPAVVAAPDGAILVVNMQLAR